MANFSLIPRLNYNFLLKDVILTPFIRNIEASGISYFENLFQTPNIFFTNHARTGLRLLLNSLNLKKNACVGVQAYNCNTVFEAIHKAGYVPVFIDINDQFTIATDDLRKKVSQIDGLIVTHTFGIPAEIEEIKAIMGDKPILEDCAHSFLSKYNNRLTGTFGDASFFSFDNAKFPSIGTGGMVVINNEKFLTEFGRLYQELMKSSGPNVMKELIKNLLVTLVHNSIIYKFFTYPFLKKLDRKLDFGGKFTWKEEKLSLLFRKLIFIQSCNFDCYLNQQKTNASIILKCFPVKRLNPGDKQIADQNFFMIPLLDKNRNKMIQSFIRKGVETGAHFHKSIDWAKNFGYKPGDCPFAEHVADNIMCLPTYYSLSSKNVNKIQKTVAEIL